MTTSPLFDPTIASAVCTQLRAEIEALVEHPPLYSRCAYTPRRTVHAVFRNGYRAAEGVPGPIASSSLLTMAYSMLEGARALMLLVEDPVLIWRVEPELVDDALYMRLCFEPRWQGAPS